MTAESARSKLTMVDELPFINFSNQTRVDRSTLSRIRSHAQQRVQDEKWSRKIGRQRGGGSKVVIPRIPERQCLKLVFEKRSKDGTRSTTLARRPKKKELETVQKNLATTKVMCQTLVVSPVDKRDPFDAFPATLNAEFMDLLEACKSPSTLDLEDMPLTRLQTTAAGNGTIPSARFSRTR